MSTAGELSGAKPRFFQLPIEQQKRHADDWYVEPAWTVDLLCEAWRTIPALAWDPACGGGTIPRALVARGVAAVGSDIADRGYGLRHDFLCGDPAPIVAAQSIVTNPPYRLAEEFVRRALALHLPVAAVLVQAKFLYSQRRHALFSEKPPAAVIHLSTRPSMPPGDLLRDGKIKAQGGKMDFCWVVWDSRHQGATVTKWAKR